jgi:Na+-transporting methylmalonyl-CoA/oxaloacetate decarboxylase gamma subunit
MSEKIKEAYRQYSRVKLAALAGLIIDAILITVLAGGFPPWAWRFLVQTIFQLPQLWRVEGPPLLLPFVGLCLLSLSLLILWVTIVGLMVKVVLHLWYDYQAKQKLQDELRVAEILAEHEFNAQEAAALAVVVAAPVAASVPRQSQWQPRPMQQVQKAVGSLGGVDTIPAFPFQ